MLIFSVQMPRQRKARAKGSGLSLICMVKDIQWVGEVVWSRESRGKNGAFRPLSHMHQFQRV